VLAAASDTGDLTVLERAAGHLKIDLGALSSAENAGLVLVRHGSIQFRHPLARSAIYADASAEERRQAHRALAAALPDRDIDRRACTWPLQRWAQTRPPRVRSNRPAIALGDAARTRLPPWRSNAPHDWPPSTSDAGTC
jgi:hypothetical protein